MGFSRNTTTSAQEVKDNLSQGATYLRNAGAAAARGTRDAAAPRVNVVLAKVGLRKAPAPKWPWVVGAIGAGIAVGGAVAYLWYRQRTETIGEALLADEMLDDTDGPHVTDAQITDELVDSVTR
ncbi:hypothetical protein [Glycomyces buryatensis]|uniref:Uncharacterized protein n=1 Tax=Glycomyces buryatensis TaxID=2570927 RepID=A0A4S8QJM9_9ACTN|nr:hypothetical protein [Glycomyces buryatensis]THV41599.1 hypothetical protein FAB82_10890 [Glycomyces buryatensis]